MTSTRPYAPATSKNMKRKVMLGARIFAILIFVVFAVMDIGLRERWIPDPLPGHLIGPKLMFLGLFAAFLWVCLSDID